MKRAIFLFLGCFAAAGFSASEGDAQNFRNNFVTPMQMVQAYNSQLGARNPYLMFQNQALLSSRAVPGSLYMGSWQSQALLNTTAAQVYGTNFGIPAEYGTVANYYSPYSYFTPFVPPVYNPYLAGGLGYGAGGFGYGAGGFGYGAGFANPYAPVGAGYGIGAGAYGDPNNPYSPFNPYNPYNPLSSPFNTTGASLMGAADVIRSYGKVINDQETARILREQALQAQLETKKKKFDLDMYIKQNTPTYTQEEAVAYKNTLVRIQNNSLPGEITNGKSLNYLLKDLSKFPISKISMDPIALGEPVLSHLNVTAGTYGLGILRDDGRVVWPTAIQAQLTVNQRKDLEDQLKALVKDAYKGKLDGNLLKDVRAEMARVTEDLVKKVNDIPSTQYMAAKRFLNEFDQATTALERGEAPVQAKFQRFAEGGRSVQELAQYMIEKGLRFAPATADDEAAYRAVHAAMAALDMGANAQFGGDAKAE